MVELLSVRGTDPTSGGRQIPFESGVALNVALEPPVALSSLNEQPVSEPDAGSSVGFPEAVSALPSVSSRPPRGLVQSLVQLPPASAVPKGPRDSLDDGWDAFGRNSSPALLAQAVASPPGAAAPIQEAVPLPNVELPREILAEDALRAPSNPPAPSEAWAEVPEDAVSEELKSAPSGPSMESLHDAVSGEPSQVSAVLDNAAVAAAIPPAWSSRPFAALEAAQRPKDAKAVLRRLAPWLGGAAIVGLGVAAIAGSSGTKQPTVESPPAKVTEPVAPEAKAPAPVEKPAPNRPTTTPAGDAESGPSDAASAGKSPFSHKAANVSLSRAVARAKTCGTSAKKSKDAPSSALAIVTFATSGAVVAVNVSGKKVSGTPVATCVSKAMRAAHVPPFEGEAVTLKRTIQFK